MSQLQINSGKKINCPKEIETRNRFSKAFKRLIKIWVLDLMNKILLQNEMQFNQKWITTLEMDWRKKCILLSFGSVMRVENRALHEKCVSDRDMEM